MHKRYRKTLCNIVPFFSSAKSVTAERLEKDYCKSNFAYPKYRFSYVCLQVSSIHYHRYKYTVSL